MKHMDVHPIYPNVLMTTEAVASILGDSRYRIIEVDMDPEAYGQGHLAGAIGWDWEQQLRNTTTHEILSPEEFADLIGKSGIGREHRIVLYGDNNNWFACWAYWLLHMIGHEQVWLMDGGARKWFSEERPVSLEVPDYPHCSYANPSYDLSNKATTENIVESFFSPGTHRLVDVRSSAEFEGRVLGPAGVPARCAVGGHIPTAINIPWNLNCNCDGTFRERRELEEMYDSFDITKENSVITYCAIGERASLSWFVLKMLLEHPTAMNYDRSMSQWSRLANAPMVTCQVA